MYILPAKVVKFKVPFAWHRRTCLGWHREIATKKCLFKARCHSRQILYWRKTILTFWQNSTIRKHWSARRHRMHFSLQSFNTFRATTLLHICTRHAVVTSVPVQACCGVGVLYWLGTSSASEISNDSSKCWFLCKLCNLCWNLDNCNFIAKFLFSYLDSIIPEINPSLSNVFLYLDLESK